MYDKSILRRGDLWLYMVFQADNIVCGEMIEPAEQNEVFDFQLRPTIFNVAVALLGFVYDAPDLCLR